MAPGGGVRRSARLVGIAVAPVAAAKPPPKGGARKLAKRAKKADAAWAVGAGAGGEGGAAGGGGESARPKRQPPLPKKKAAKPAKGGPTRDHERRLWAKGLKRVAGVDEAGRGPLAGPVVAAACVLPENVSLPGVDDSKQLTEEQREELYDVIVNDPRIHFAYEVLDRDVIDDINILAATMRAMDAAVAKLPGGAPDFVLVDGNRLPTALKEGGNAEAIVKGDGKVSCIAAASIVAKVTRDRIMVEYDRQFPEYGFAKHKGYGTAAQYAEPNPKP